MEKKHNTSIQTQDLENNTLPVKSFHDLKRMTIYEALLIIEQRPDINRQKVNFINPLKLYSRSPHATNTSAPTTHQAPVNPSPILLLLVIMSLLKMFCILFI